ncbi:putative malic acid transport protein [Diplogelasinospora grovesii]|uniref:Malic acid transport protein n=1 Tax=Diplogelasinospora grovesii TaxID=303347 RepID=A0AAN6N0G7_9PEZI|nr:putative malic acid transport protein [Diplogelasinospora grovesii]
MPSPDISPLPPTRLALREFTSQWFLVPQGTGIIALILHQLDCQFRGLKIISYIFWVITIVLWFAMLLIYGVRSALYPKSVAAALRDTPIEINCLSSISITFTSIIQMMALVLVQGWARGWGIAVYVLWWVNVAMAILACIVLAFFTFRVFPSKVSSLSPGTQLPFIAALTVAAGGGTVAKYAEISCAQQVAVIIVSYLFLGTGFTIAFALDVLYLSRLMHQSLPRAAQAYQDMILCGPWGQGSFALQILGQVVLTGAFAGEAQGVFLTARAADPVGFASIFAGLLSWGAGTFWWTFAVFSILRGVFNGYRPKPPPFGVYTHAAIQLGKLLDSTAFKVWSTVLTILLVVIWLVNVAQSIRGVLSGSLLGLEHGWRRI